MTKLRYKSVRRGHNKADGKLQNVEMDLYRGHIAPGSKGVPEVGGKKTLVKDAIVEKIGLTFEQFTRAVLLAQNDFATFLKADDKQRAEILQALTGTEHFEAISRAVFARYSAEKKAIDDLEAQLGGFQPMKEEARLEADAAALAATNSVQQIEANLQQLAVHAEWFRQHAKLLAELQKAKTEFAAATERRTAASERRAELSLTETVGHDARAWRDDELRAAKNIETARLAFAAAETTLKTHTAASTTATEKVTAATTALLQVQEEQTIAAPLLNRARDLDSRLQPLQSRVEEKHGALVQATAAKQDATKNRDAAATRRQLLAAEQQSLQVQLASLATFVPFVKESATWQHRLDAAITAGSEAEKLRAEFDSLTKKLQAETRELKTKRDELAQAPVVRWFPTRSVTAEPRIDPQHPGV